MRESAERLTERKRSVGERLWLHYYNRVLYERGIISEAERNRMSNRIDARERVEPRQW